MRFDEQKQYNRAADRLQRKHHDARQGHRRGVIDEGQLFNKR